MLLSSNFINNYPLFCLTISIILFLGLYQSGEYLLKIFSFNYTLSKVSNPNYQKIMLSSNFIMVFLMPLILFTQFAKVLLFLTSTVLLILGIVCICKNLDIFIKIKDNFTKKKKISVDQIFFLFIIIGFFLISLAPVNHADAIDYHMSIAQQILSDGQFPNTLFNTHHLLGGAGEILISIGLVFGAEQFGTLIQFSGLLSIVGIFAKHRKDNYIFILLAIAIPTIVFLSSSPKPQLLPLATNFFIFSLLFFNPEKLFKYKKELYFIITVSIILLINSINSKFSFILSSSILYIYVLRFAFKKNFLKETILISIICALFFYSPFILWKYLSYGGNLFSYIFNPFPVHLEGVDNFKNYLVNFKREYLLIFSIIPKNIKQFTDAIGVGVLFIPLIFKIKSHKLEIFFVVGVFISIVLFIGQPSGRFFIEPYLWLLLLLSKLDRNFINLPFKFIVRFQSVVIIFAIYFAVITLSVGSLSASLRENVMTKSANGYALFKWADDIIEDEGAVISMHRSVSFGKNKTLSTVFLYYLNEDQNPKVVIEQLQRFKPKYFLTFQDPLQKIKNFSIFEDCFDLLIAKKDNVGKHAARNPFGRGSEFYAGLLFKLKDVKLSSCIDMKKTKT
jgi:hypothetical protein